MSIDRWLIRIGLAMVATGVLGEILGWWDDAGIWVSALGAAGGLWGVLNLNGREAVRLLHPLDGKQDRVLEGQAQMLEGQTQMLDVQARMLEGQHGTNERLDQLIWIVDERL